MARGTKPAFSTLCIFIATISPMVTPLPAKEEGLSADLEAAKKLLREYDEEMSLLTNKATVAEWNFNTNITDDNKEKKTETATAVTEYVVKISEQAAKFDLSALPDEERRLMKKLTSKQLEKE